MMTFFRFLLVGVLNTLVGLTVTLICFHLFQTGYWGATAIGNACGVWVSYMLNRRFTFRQETGGWSYWIRFLFVVSISYLIAYRFSLSVVNYILPHLQETGAILIGMIIYTGLNYLGQSYWVFRKR
ncbi:GtrA family protein [Exiguobacterium sp. A1_3_1]|uniref:GtrA family protein n=1 Tax=Exiguobacterium sp. A1_3_1 TaxID=2651871 RepID=UPI003B88AA33